MINTRIHKKSKYPLFLIGQGPLCSKESENIFNYLLNLHNNITGDNSWNGFNIIQKYSGRVGALDLGFYNAKNLKKIFSMISTVVNIKFYIFWEQMRLILKKFQMEHL